MKRGKEREKGQEGEREDRDEREREEREEERREEGSVLCLNISHLAIKYVFHQFPPFDHH